MTDPTQGVEPISSIVRRLSKALSVIASYDIVDITLWMKGLRQSTEGRVIVLIDRIVLSLAGAAASAYVLSFFSTQCSWIN
jgi:hypothetical protein